MGDHVGRRGRGGYCKLYNLFQLKKMRRGDTCARCADIERLGQFNEARALRIRTPKKNRDLDANAGGLPLLRGGHQVLCLKKLTRH
jgi:hypothetical protein